MVRNPISSVNRKVNTADTQARALNRPHSKKSVDNWLPGAPSTTSSYNIKDGFRQGPSISAPINTASRLNPHAKPFVPSSFPTTATTKSPNCIPTGPTLTDAGSLEQSGPSTLMSVCASAEQRAATMSAAAHMIPHPAKQAKGGEDAFFIDNTTGTVGVADGVGGWEALGVDSGLYSRSLMTAAAEYAAREPTSAAADILRAAYNQCLRIPGSSTACVVRLRPEARALDAINLGDSGFVLIRDGRVVFRTKEQQHYFNCPFQIGSSRDTPDDGTRLTVEGLQDGDVMVLASDGLWDNMHTEQLLSLVKFGGSPVEISSRIAEEAHRIAADPAANTPFQEGARKNGQLWKGGKLDDITVLVAVINVPPASASIFADAPTSVSPPSQSPSPVGSASPLSSALLQTVAPPPGLGGERRAAANNRHTQHRHE